MSAGGNKVFEIAFQLGGTVTSSMRQAFREARESMGNVSESSSVANKALGALKIGGAVAVAAVGAVAAGMSAAVTATDDYNNAMNQLQASTGASAEEMKEIKEISKTLYNQNLGEDFNDLAISIHSLNKE